MLISIFSGCAITRPQHHPSEIKYLKHLKQLIEKGEHRYSIGQFKQAVYTWEKALSEIDAQIYYEIYIKTLKQLAGAYQTLGYAESAKRLFKKAIPVVNDSSDFFVNTLFYCSMADFYTAIRQPEKAEEALNLAIEQSRLAHHPQARAIVQNNLGNLHAINGEYDDALIAYENSLKIITESGENFEIISEILLNIVRVKVYRVYGKYQRDDYKRITDAFNRAYRAIRTLPEGYKKAARLISFSLLIQDFRKELQVAMRDLENSVSLIIKGEEFYYQGHLEHAVFNWEEALFILDTEKYIGIYIDTLLNLASVYQAFGNYENALSAYQKTLPLINRSSDRYRNARFFSQMGELFLFLEDVKQGLTFLKKAVDEARQVKNSQILARVLQKKGDGLTADRYFMGAMSAYEDSLNRIEELSKDSDIHVAALIENIRNQIKQAKKKLQQSIQKAMMSFQSQNRQDIQYDDYAEIILSLDDIDQDIQTLLDLFKQEEEEQTVKIYSQRIRKEIQTADDFLQPISYHALTHANSIADSMGNRRLLAHSHAALSDIYAENHRYDRAINQIRQAVFYAQENNLTDILYRFQWKLARLFSARNNPSRNDLLKSIETYQMAIDTLNPGDPPCLEKMDDSDAPVRMSIYNVRKDLINAYPTGISFEKDIKPLYVERVGVLLSQALKPNQSKESTKGLVVQALDTLERLKLAEYKDFFQDECLGNNLTSLSVDSNQLVNTNPQTAIIYPLFMKNRVVIILITQKQIQIYPVNARREQVEETALEFRKALENRDQELYRGYAGQLYIWLMRPMEENLQDNTIKTLLIVPDGVLRLVPFAALYDGFDYLIKQYAIAYLPKISGINPQWLPRKNVNLFFGGLSKTQNDILPRHHIETDYKAIAHAMNHLIKTHDILNRSFSLKKVARRFKKTSYEIVHLTSYCQMGKEPIDFSINAYNHFIKINDIESLLNQNSLPGLVVLDYCKTLKEDQRSTLFFSGFPIKTGAHSLLFSLWTDRDIAGSDIVPEFYRQLIRTPYQSRAEALQSAQIETLGKPRFHHPFFWSGFMLIGDWL
jgi:CHAT domain-containing protein/Tfp pilus assembly protein PilF